MNNFLNLKFLEWLNNNMNMIIHDHEGNQIITFTRKIP